MKMTSIINMTSLWNRVNHSAIEGSKKGILFVGINILFWTAAAFLLCLVGGLIRGSFDGGWAFVTFLITGYSGVIMGFFRSVFYLIRK